jgi:hypothetical protein
MLAVVFMLRVGSSNKKEHNIATINHTRNYSTVVSTAISLVSYSGGYEGYGSGHNAM